MMFWPSRPRLHRTEGIGFCKPTRKRGLNCEPGISYPRFRLYAVHPTLFDGSVRPSGVELHLESRFGAGLDNVGARHRMIVAGKLDGGELSISSFIFARLRGVPLRALPVFLSRRFRLRCMYCWVE